MKLVLGLRKPREPLENATREKTSHNVHSSTVISIFDFSLLHFVNSWSSFKWWNFSDISPSPLNIKIYRFYCWTEYKAATLAVCCHKVCQIFCLFKMTNFSATKLFVPFGRQGQFKLTLLTPLISSPATLIKHYKFNNIFSTSKHPIFSS